MLIAITTHLTKPGRDEKGQLAIGGYVLVPDDSVQEIRVRIQELSARQLKAIRDAAYLGMTPKVAKECRDRREVISKLVDRMKEYEEGRELVSKLLNQLAGLSD